jgi:hypothetical protein
MNFLYRAFRGMSQGNQLFAIKAGILTSRHLCLGIRKLVLTCFLHSPSQHSFIPQIICFFCLWCVLEIRVASSLEYIILILLLAR